MNRKRKIDIDRDELRTEARKLDGTGLRVWLVPSASFTASAGRAA